MSDDNERTSLKFWIAALAFSMLLMASTFALLAAYMSEIKNNTVEALLRTDSMTQRLMSMETEITALHRRIVVDKASATPGVAVESPTATIVPDVAPTAASSPATGSLPPVEAPVLAPANVGTVTPPASVPAPK